MVRNAFQTTRRLLTTYQKEYLHINESSKPAIEPHSFTVTQVPGTFVRGTTDTSLHKNKKTIEALEHSNIYQFLTSTIAPRPIALVSSKDAQTGALNVAPFSFFNVMLYDPPILALANTGTNDRVKDTTRNLSYPGAKCCVNLIHEDMVQAANFTSIDAPEGVDEFQLSGLTPVDNNGVPYVSESVVSFECEVVSVQKFEGEKRQTKYPSTIFLVKVLRVHVNEEALNEKQTVDIDVLKPVSRLGGNLYGRTTQAYELGRPVHAKENVL